MEFGIDIDTGLRISPKKDLQAKCPVCEVALIAKCGPFKLHHWAHKGRLCSDTWKENESQWHRDWKSYFPKDWREVVRIDEVTGEKHRADIHIPNKDLYIEFQHSSISIPEIESREKFYKKLIWVVNGNRFNFNLSKPEILYKYMKAYKYDIGIKRKQISDLYCFDKSRIEALRALHVELLNKITIFRYEDCINKFVSTFFLFYEAMVTSHSLFEKSDLIIKSSELFLELIEPLFKKAEESLNDKIKEKDIIFHYAFPSKIWQTAKMPIFIDYDEKLYLLRSKNICIMVTIQGFKNKYAIVKEIE